MTLTYSQQFKFKVHIFLEGPQVLKPLSVDINIFARQSQNLITMDYKEKILKYVEGIYGYLHTSN